MSDEWTVLHMNVRKPQIISLAEIKCMQVYIRSVCTKSTLTVFTGRYGTKVDLWATGVVCYVMLCGVSPFNTCPEDKNVTGK